jgi:hypothetical protein
MTGPTHRKKRVTQGLLMGLLVAGIGGAVTAQPAFPGETQPAPSDQTQTRSGASAGQPPAKTPDAVPGRAPGMMIHIDPTTGAILKEPAPGTVPLQLTPQLQNALSTSHQGLVETPGTVPGGGVKVDLQGRFQSPLVVTIDADGKVKMQHLDETPESGDKK